ncbi:MAG: single-stranded-DNA-specific exonuclease RecJ [Alphaproteobacteria bacterium]
MKISAAVAQSSSQPEFALGVSQSFSGRAWRLRDARPEAVRLLELQGLSPGLSRVLAARGITAAESDAFLNPRIRTGLPDSFVLHDMERAAERFARAAACGECVGVLADYDVDGSASAALLLRFLRAVGNEAPLIVPDRIKDGYGPSPRAMRELHSRGCRLVVTVDCGASAHGALEVAQRIGLDVVVLDHHKVETNPPAFAHVNPNGPDCRSELTQLCATGVTFVFLIGVQRLLRKQGFFSGRAEPDLLSFLDLVALATIADVVPLQGINRAFVRQGLRILDSLERPGLAALARAAGISPPFTTYHLGFMFGPRINAGGRVGRSDLGAMLLATEIASDADAWARELDRHNRERQAIEAAILDVAQAMALAQSEAPFVLCAGDGWHAGVVGIVAGRLRERHAKPALVAGFDGGIGRGSARSVPGVDLGAIVRAAKDANILETGGGHAMAAGFSLKPERFDDFRAFLTDALEPQRSIIAAANDLLADAFVSAAGVTAPLIDDISRAGPFGAGNPEPIFVVPDVTVAYADVVGTNHVRLRLVARDGASLNAIAFRSSDAPLGRGLLKSRGRRICVAGKIRSDTYRQEAGVQLHVEDAASAAA